MFCNLLNRGILGNNNDNELDFENVLESDESDNENESDDDN